MKRYGRQKQHPGNLEDIKVDRNHLRWWEVEFHNGNKKRARQGVSKEIEKVLSEECKGCEHYFALNDYCKLFAKKKNNVTSIQRKYCFTYSEEKEVKRIESKEW